MDQFKKPRGPQRKTAAVDGFITANQSTLRQNRAGQLQQNRLDNFGPKQGFRSNAQPILKDSARQKQAQEQRTFRVDNPGQITLPPAAPKRGQHKKHHPFRTGFKVFGVVFAILFITGGYLFAKGYMQARNVFKGGGNAPALAANVDVTKLKGEGDGRVNILLLGRGGEGHDGADLTDTILVASIDPIQKQASLLSVPRDLWVKNGSGYSKINQVYADAKSRVLVGKKTADIQQRAQEAGEQAIESTIEGALGIPVHYYVLVDFKAFEQAINTVGGVDIYVDPKDTSGIVREQLWDEMTGKNYVLDVKPGNNHFDGQRALMYSRSRHTSARGDFDRSERQRKMIVALKEKILSAGTYGNPAKINELINAFGTHVQSNMSPSDIKRLHDIAGSIDSSKISSLDLVTPPNSFIGGSTSSTGLSIQIPKAGIGNYSEIQSYVRNALRDSYLQKENANIAVYNGTSTSGLASKKATDLKSYGYGITTVANAADQTHTKTVIVDLTNGQKKYTKHYLEQRLNATATTTLPTDSAITASNADFVIILGTDAISSR